MKLKNSLLLLALTTLVNLHAEDSNSAKHYGISAAFGFASETVIHKYFTELNDFEKISYATVVGTLPGLAKELHDEEFSNEDLAYDALGALTGAIFSNYLNNNSSIFISHSEENKSTKLMLAHNF